MSILGMGSSATLPAVSLGPVAVLFAILTLLLTPVSLLTSILGFFRKRFALLTGVLAIVSSAGWIVALDALSPEAEMSAGLGTFAVLLGGIVALAAYLMVRGRMKLTG